MVVGHASDVRGKKMESQTLKFGMDRILSEDVSPIARNLEAPCVSVMPCAGCMSALFKCCRASPALAEADAYGSALRAPRPLRPYASVLIPGDSGAPPQQQLPNGGGPRRKRSWSRAVFSNLQRKGLEKRFQLQKYITKPDRRQLAATLGLTDAQVKVWFQNRRMKWRHTKETPRQNQATKNSEENILVTADSTQAQNTDSECESDIDVQTVDG